MIPFEAYIVHENPLWDLGKEAENPSLDYKMRVWFSQRNTPQDSQDNLLMHAKLIVNNIHDKLHDYFQLPFTGNWAGYTLEIVKNAKGKMMKGSERSNSVYILEQFSHRVSFSQNFVVFLAIRHGTRWLSNQPIRTQEKYV